MNCLETTEGNPQLYHLHHLRYMVWGFGSFFSFLAWLYIAGQGEGFIANTESREERVAQQTGEVIRNGRTEHPGSQIQLGSSA